ncbi:MAG TPA: glycosyltransferase family A protein [Acidobacteriaceae bacterium]|jgi:glycosyltransferase involved in cell wall biosynthesis|nr:glycosyltransferase family A protein [Acidobacteriaceae bacterium]
MRDTLAYKSIHKQDDGTDGSVAVTVLLCTYNRSASLERALSSIAKSIMPDSATWELIVVDNNSTDRTREVANTFCSRDGRRFRYVFEPTPGLSNARNCGIRESRGSILAFVDDDVTVEPTWLNDLTSVLHDGEWAGAGGRILPAREFTPPRWLTLEGPMSLIGALCAYYNPGDTGGELRDPPYGANMAFRREMFDKYGAFRTDLGRGPNDMLGHEDTEFGQRLIMGGERLRYVPSAIVYHEIHENRVRKEFFLLWWFGFGRSSVRQRETNFTTLQSLNIIARAVLTAPRWLLSIEPRRRFYSKCRVWYAAGKLVETWKRRLGRSRGKHEDTAGASLPENPESPSSV